MDCDDDGRDCVGDTGTRRRDRRVRGWGDGGERKEGTTGCDALRRAIWHCEAHAGEDDDVPL